ncbi:MAG: class I SAM-dependent rRNA methyltransferase [Phaeodactylibacter sp.]|uniref:class I SAM-dependent rRNA methyltransferase n=1 Tax=Phaeodactylibacter sp. TaxID=1940289 RepID=UPI0032EFD60B
METFANLPAPPGKRLAIHVKPAAERALRREHPWIFEEAIAKQNATGEAGSLAIIFDRKKDKFLAAGFYDPHSPIRIKALQFGKPAKIEASWFAGKIAQAFEKRKPLLATDTNSYRLLYGENDGLPGFVADVYDQVLVIKLYSFIWLPYLKWVLPPLLQLSRCATVVLRLSRNLQALPELCHGLSDGQVIVGTLPQEEVIFREHGLRFSANVVKGHKTGYFLDHRHNRKRVGELAQGKTVLDVFAYAGGFSVHALAGGALSVTSLDISAQALEMAAKNVALNQLEGRHRVLAGDAFEQMTQLKKAGAQFDLIIVDPPSFAKQRSERSRALEAYQQLAQLAADILAPKGLLLLASCSSRVTAPDFFEAVLRVLDGHPRHFRESDRTYHDIDHPIGFPEGAYLKAIYIDALN